VSNLSEQPKTPSPDVPKIGPFRLLDAWRAIASLLVVMYHWAEIVTRRTPELRENPLYQFSSFGWIGVQIFFVISGYCIAASACSILRRGDSTGAYFKARLERIFPTYWAAIVFTLLVVVTANALASRGIIPPNTFTESDPTGKSFYFFLTNLTLTMLPLKQPAILPVAWTLCYELSFYLVIGLALAAAQRTRRQETLMFPLHLLTVAILAGLVIAPDFMRFGPIVFGYHLTFELWPQFGLGVMVYDVLSRPGQRAPRLWLTAALVLTGLFVLLHSVFIGAGMTGSRVSFSTAGLFALYLVYAYSRDAKWSTLPGMRPLISIGIFSYSLYLTHFMVIRLLNQLMQKIGIPAQWHYLPFAIAVIGAIGAAYLFFLLFEKPLLSRKKKPGKEPKETAETIKTPVVAAVARVPGVAE
jgi:exopolysaccharide production protein ExoZ